MRGPLWQYSLFPVSLLALQVTSAALGDFDPKSFPKSVAKCKGLNRKDDVVKDIEIHYVDINPQAQKTLLMVHGWPGLWSNWANQIIEFQNDYHIIAPDHRGFGSSSHPDDVESSGTFGDIVGDLVCVPENAGVDRAICIGHDWGSQSCWEAARMRPDIFEGVVGAAVPYVHAAGEYTPISALLGAFPGLSYQLFFSDKTAEAVAELDKDIRRTLRATYRSIESPPPSGYLRSKDTFLGAYDAMSEIPPSPYFTQDDEDYMVEQYSIQGFRNTLQFYTHGNRYGSWKFSHDQGNYTIAQPALSILPDADSVADMVTLTKLLGSERFLPDFKMEILHTGHWVQLEQPAQFNAILRKWLNSLPHKQTEEAKQTHFADEL